MSEVPFLQPQRAEERETLEWDDVLPGNNPEVTEQHVEEPNPIPEVTEQPEDHGIAPTALVESPEITSEDQVESTLPQVQQEIVGDLGVVQAAIDEAAIDPSDANLSLLSQVIHNSAQR